MIRLFVVLSTFMLCSFLTAMEYVPERPSKHVTAGISYRQAMADDIPALIQLIDSFTPDDKHSLLVLPIHLRESSLQSAIQNGRLFVAINDKEAVIAFKKLFVIKDDEERESILVDEIRCLDRRGAYRAAHAGCGRFSINAAENHIRMDAQESLSSSPRHTLFIYNGSDYTLPEYRRLGINSELTRAALRIIYPQIREILAHSSYQTVGLVYGLVKELAGEQLIEGRTRAIALVLTQEIASLTDEIFPPVGGLCLECIRFDSYKPEFDPITGALIPDAVPGFGYLLSFSLGSKNL